MVQQGIVLSYAISKKGMKWTKRKWI